VREMEKKGTAPQITIVVPTYNGSNIIDRCIGSLRSLDYPNERLEVIIVDDGSTDSTPAILERYDMTVIRHETNKGASVARNTGIKYATGDIILFVDQDVMVPQNLLNEMVKHYHGNVGGVGFRGIARAREEGRAERSTILDLFQSAREKKKALEYSTRDLRTRGIDPKKLTLGEKLFFFSAPTACMSYRKHVLNEIGGFNERIPFYGEDFELKNRVTDAGYNIVLVKDIKFLHLIETRRFSLYGTTKLYFIRGIARSRVLKVMGKRLISYLTLNYLISRFIVLLGLFTVTSFVIHQLFSSYLLSTILPIILLFLFYELKEGYNTSKVAGRKSLTPIFFLFECLRSVIMSVGFVYDIISSEKRVH